MAAVDHTASAATTETLYRLHGRRVLRYCLACLRRPADAEDALQQTFLQAHRALGRGEQPVSEVAWLLAIARNVCLTRADAQRRRSRTETLEDPQVLDEIATSVDADEALSAEVHAAFARLSERQRHALFLREWQGASYAEIAVALGTTESAVETLIFRARRALADELGPRRGRRAPVAAGFGWLRTWFGSTAAKVAVGAATASVAAGTAVTLEVRPTVPQPARAVTPVAAAPRPAAAPSPVRAVVERRRPATGSVRRRVPVPRVRASRTVAPPQPAPPTRDGDVRPAPPEPVSSPSAASTTAGRVVASPATTTTTVAAGTVDALGSAVAGTVDAVVQTADATTSAAQQATGAAAQTVDGAVQAATTTVGGVAQSVGDAIPPVAPATTAVSQILGGG